jgi:hypothetical protein
VADFGWNKHEVYRYAENERCRLRTTVSCVCRLNRQESGEHPVSLVSIWIGFVARGNSKPESTLQMLIKGNRGCEYRDHVQIGRWALRFSEMTYRICRRTIFSCNRKPNVLTEHVFCQLGKERVRGMESKTRLHLCGDPNLEIFDIYA